MFRVPGGRGQTDLQGKEYLSLTTRLVFDMLLQGLDYSPTLSLMFTL